MRLDETIVPWIRYKNAVERREQWPELAIESLRSRRQRVRRRQSEARQEAS